VCSAAACACTVCVRVLVHEYRLLVYIYKHTRMCACTQSTFHASQDIADIDSRINKLQSFLKMAKSGSMR
jgi:hypothetical protein